MFSPIPAACAFEVANIVTPSESINSTPMLLSINALKLVPGSQLPFASCGPER